MAGTKYPNGENIFNPDGSFNPPRDPIDFIVYPGQAVNAAIDAAIERVWKDLEREKHLSDIEFVNQNARGK